MELPDQFTPVDHIQDCALITALHQVNEEQDYELEDPMELASDLLRKLHELGFYIAECGKSVGFEHQ